MLLNESAVRAMNLKEPIGQIIKDNGIDWQVVGVIKDFILSSPFSKIAPLVIEGTKGWFTVVYIRLNPKNSTAQNLKKVYHSRIIIHIEAKPPLYKVIAVLNPGAEKEMCPRWVIMV
jgi:hypothetical protein